MSDNRVVESWKLDPSNAWCLICDRGAEGCGHPYPQAHAQSRRLADGSVAGTPRGIRVFPVDGVFVVADAAGWIDGEFASVEEAVDAARGGRGAR